LPAVVFPFLIRLFRLAEKEMQPNTIPAGISWFSKTSPDSTLGANLVAFTEPFLNDYFRANFYHLKGRDLDLVVDTGMGLAPLVPLLDLTPGKPVLAVATHVHADHVGSLFEFSERAGPRLEAEAFATMEDRWTFADEFRRLSEPVSMLPCDGWRVEDYRIRPAPLTQILDEGDHIETGDRSFTVLHLPGHSLGCIGLYEERDGLLFPGDAVYDDELIDDMWCSNRDDYRSTMHRLMDLPVRIVHGGHGESFGEARLKEIAQEYLARP
jgi:glyoxylase-like metal-dependent hydrolase (beta-lactamase superfamily II)